MSSSINTPAPVHAIGDRPLVRLEGIGVSFGATIALVDESIDVYPGEIIGLLGHNGAGKSTLLNVATGALRPTTGTMEIDGVPASLRGNPRQLERAGIKVIHQEPALVPNLEVWENICLGTSHDRSPMSKQIEVAAESLSEIGAHGIDVRAKISDLSFGERQLVDVARSIATELRVIFLDEPTAALGKSETAHLHRLLEGLAANGRGVVYVSHRLKDVLSLCTRLVVLRDGEVVLDKPNIGITAGDLTQSLSAARPTATPRDHGVTDDDGDATGAGKIRDASVNTLVVHHDGARLEFPGGTVTGLFGMAADAQFDLLESLFGIGSEVSASIGPDRYSPRRPVDAQRQGVHFLSADRERDSLVHGMSAIDNVTLPWLRRLSGLLGVSRHATSDRYAQARDVLAIRGAAPGAAVSAFSGGNRQKIALARWMLVQPPRVLLLAQPTQGVDVEARADIAAAVRRAAAAGACVLVASSESDEIDRLCDAAYVRHSDSWSYLPRNGYNFEELLLTRLLGQDD
jgi:ABC-type sugar transport system ATPase subunit